MVVGLPLAVSCLYIMLFIFCSHMVKVRDVNRYDLDWM